MIVPEVSRPYATELASGVHDVILATDVQSHDVPLACTYAPRYFLVCKMQTGFVVSRVGTTSCKLFPCAQKLIRSAETSVRMT
jgi:hypothetical protein